MVSADAPAPIEGTGLEPALADQMEGKFLSGFVRARKPKPKIALSERKPKRACGCDDDCCS